MRFPLSILLSLATVAAAEPRAFLEKHCYECHDKETKKGGLDLTSLGSEKQQLDRWIKVHDAVVDGEQFWGVDATDMLLAFLKGDPFFSSAAYRDAHRLPAAVHRQR